MTISIQPYLSYQTYHKLQTKPNLADKDRPAYPKTTTRNIKFPKLSKADEIIQQISFYINSNDTENLKKLLEENYFMETVGEVYQHGLEIRYETAYTIETAYFYQKFKQRPTIEYLALNHFDDLYQIIDAARKQQPLSKDSKDENSEEDEIQNDDSESKGKEKIKEETTENSKTALTVLLESFQHLNLERGESIDFGDKDLTGFSFKGANLRKSRFENASNVNFSGLKNISQCVLSEVQKATAPLQNLFDDLLEYAKSHMEKNESKRNAIDEIGQLYRLKLNQNLDSDQLIALKSSLELLIIPTENKYVGHHRKLWLNIAKEMLVAIPCLLTVLGGAVYLGVSTYNLTKKRYFGVFPDTHTESAIKKMSHLAGNLRDKLTTKIG